MFLQALLHGLVFLAIFQVIWVLYCEIIAIFSHSKYVVTKYISWHLPLLKVFRSGCWTIMPRLCAISIIIFVTWLVSFIVIILPFDIHGFAELNEDRVRVLYLFEFLRPQESMYFIKITFIFFMGFAASLLGWMRLDLLIQTVQPYKY